MLTAANMSHNAIEVIADLSHHPFLECLILSHNMISKIEGVINLRFLKVNLMLLFVY
jgi:hypothetical protein